jgi:hypothetical protein
MIKEQVIILKIKYDSEQYSEPVNWDWAGMLDTSDNTDVEVLDYQDIIN